MDFNHQIIYNFTADKIDTFYNSFFFLGLLILFSLPYFISFIRRTNSKYQQKKKITIISTFTLLCLPFFLLHYVNKKTFNQYLLVKTNNYHLIFEKNHYFYLNNNNKLKETIKQINTYGNSINVLQVIKFDKNKKIYQRKFKNGNNIYFQNSKSKNKLVLKSFLTFYDKINDKHINNILKLIDLKKHFLLGENNEPK